MHEVERAVREANVVENIVNFLRGNVAANGSFDQIADLSGLLNARSTLRANMQNELPVVGIGEKVLAKPRHKQKCREANQQECRNEYRPPVDCGGEQ